jgi:predicted transcriptional regulator
MWSAICEDLKNMPRLPKRNKEQKIFDVLYYVIDHPLCHKNNIVSRCGLSNATGLVYDLYTNGYIKYSHVKSLRKNCNLIAITRKGIDFVYTRQDKLKPSYKNEYPDSSEHYNPQQL